MTCLFSGRNTRGRLFRLGPLLAGLGVLGCAAALRAQPGVESLKLGAAALEAGRHEEAIRLLREAQRMLRPLADYAAFFAAQAHARSRQFEAVPALVEAVLSRPTPSAISGRAAVLGAEAALELNQPKLALALLGRVPQEIWPQPQGFVALARAHEAAGDLVAASVAWQSLWLRYPASPESAGAAAALARLEQLLGAEYPPVMPQALLERAARLAAERQFQAARQEYERIARLLAGLERERAQIGAAAALLGSRETARALDLLLSLRPAFPEAEAERQFHLVTCFLRLDRLHEMVAAAGAAARAAPDSEWARKALIAAANRLLVENDLSQAGPLYQACADLSASSEDAAYCHWKTVWRLWLARDPAAAGALRDHLRRFPASEKAAAALYFLAREADSRSDPASARRFLAEITQRFPNSYYGVLARQRLARPDSSQAEKPPAAVESFLASIAWPARPRTADFQPDAATALLIDRGRLLARAGLDRWAESELRFGVRQGAKPYPAAMALHDIATARGDHAQALRWVIATANGYLWLDPAGAPAAFWKAAFPFPFHSSILKHASANDLDPFLLAGLIRQESLFDPKAVSSAGAIGLTQVMPATGRTLARRAGVQGYRVALLKSPEVNLRIGAYYLRQQLNQRGGSIEETLAGYNAGPSRVTRWKSWADFREPAEFVETIPFTQTRDYVQIIVRNAEIYRRLYSASPPSPLPKPTQAKPAPARKAPAKAKLRR